MNIQEFFNDSIGISVRVYENNGVLYFNLEDVAKGLGFIKTEYDRPIKDYVNSNHISPTCGPKNFYTKIRWDRVNHYLNEIGYNRPENDLNFPNFNKDDYIPESIFYRLAMKAKNDVAKVFQSWLSEEVIPSIRKYGGYTIDNIPKIKILESILNRAFINSFDVLKIFANLSKENEDFIIINLINIANELVGLPLGKDSRENATIEQLIEIFIAEASFIHTINSVIRQFIVDRKLIDVYEVLEKCQSNAKDEIRLHKFVSSSN